LKRIEEGKAKPAEGTMAAEGVLDRRDYSPKWKKKPRTKKKNKWVSTTETGKDLGRGMKTPNKMENVRERNQGGHVADRFTCTPR